MRACIPKPEPKALLFFFFSGTCSLTQHQQAHSHVGTPVLAVDAVCRIQWFSINRSLIDESRSTMIETQIAMSKMTMVMVVVVGGGGGLQVGCRLVHLCLAARSSEEGISS